jgi:hypothetical protein
MTYVNSWVEYLRKTLLVGGVLFWCIFALMQMGVDVVIQLPTIEHTFKGK